MSDLQFVLSDEFVAYSASIAEIHKKKKEKSSEFKALYEQFQDQLEELDAEAKKLTEEFEAWKAAATTKKSK